MSSRGNVGLKGLAFVVLLVVAHLVSLLGCLCSMAGCSYPQRISQVPGISDFLDPPKQYSLHSYRVQHHHLLSERLTQSRNLFLGFKAENNPEDLPEHWNIIFVSLPSLHSGSHKVMRHDKNVDRFFHRMQHTWPLVQFPIESSFVTETL